MRRPAFAALLLLTTSVAIPATANAQERKGFWFAIGGGIGSGTISTSAFDADRDAVGVGDVALGWALNPRVLVGFELQIMQLDLLDDLAAATGSIDAYNTSAIVLFYPAAASGFFVKGGAGGSFLDLTIEGGGTTLTGNIAKGFGFTLGAGYDVRVWRRLSLTPAVSFWYGRPGTVELFGQTLSDDWTHNVLDATISIKLN